MNDKGKSLKPERRLNGVIIGWTLGAFAVNVFFGRVPFMLFFLMHDYLSALTWVVAGTVMCIWKKIEGSL